MKTKLKYQIYTTMNKFEQKLYTHLETMYTLLE